MRDREPIILQQVKLVLVVCALFGCWLIVGDFSLAPADLMSQIQQESFAFSQTTDCFEHAIVPLMEPPPDCLRSSYDELFENFGLHHATAGVDSPMVETQLLLPKVVAYSKACPQFKSTNAFSPSNPGNYQILPLLT